MLAGVDGYYMLHPLHREVACDLLAQSGRVCEAQQRFIDYTSRLHVKLERFEPAPAAAIIQAGGHDPLKLLCRQTTPASLPCIRLQCQLLHTIWQQQRGRSN